VAGDPGTRLPFSDYDKTYAYYVVRDGESSGQTVWAKTLEEITRVDEMSDRRVVYVEEGFFAYEPENDNRLAWRVRDRARRRLWAAEYRAQDVTVDELS
jgi:hypothetical protein